MDNVDCNLWNYIGAYAKTRGAQKSELKPSRIKTWDGFRRHVNALEHRKYIFRGQEDHKWRLRTSFHRTGRSNLERYVTQDIPELHKHISSLLPYPIDLHNPIHYAALLSLGQHHGYPTPLLDWTWSPYVAAFFAFRGIPMNAPTERKIRIFKFNIGAWNQLPRADKIFPVQPNVSILDAIAMSNPRALPQQALSTISNMDDIETHIRKSSQ